MEVKNLSYLMLEGLKVQSLSITGKANLSKVTINSNEYYKENLNETTQRLLQATRTISSVLFDSSKISNIEFMVIREISKDLVYCNSLWRCTLDFNNKSNRVAMAGLLEKQIIFKTECKDLFIVNPYYIRYGEFFEVLHSTLRIIDVKELNIGLAKIVKPFKGELVNS